MAVRDYGRRLQAPIQSSQSQEIRLTNAREPCVVCGNCDCTDAVAVAFVSNFLRDKTQ